VQTTTYDAIVVGSGISGGWAAKELTEKGLNVLLLERGKNIEHIKDYVNATKPPWAYPHRGGRTKSVGVGQRLALYRGKALRLVPRLSCRRPVADVGATELPP
jgi:choline dehydrogenase-like flavoprotein